MADDVERVKAEVVGRLQPAEFVQGLGERIGAQLTAAAVFGDPIEREGTTVIPVARAVWGFGGGGGVGDEEQRGHGEGAGGGGGGAVKPIGLIEVRASGAEFKLLRAGPPASVVAAAAGLAALAISRLTRR